MAERTPTRVKSIESLLEKHDAKMRSLFLKVMNAHAGYQLVARSESELLGEMREAIREACGEDGVQDHESKGTFRQRRSRREEVEL